MPRRTRAVGFHAGGRVRFRFGGRLVRGTVVDDRGPVGAQGRRLLRVSLKVDSSEELERAARTEAAMRPVEKGAAPAYLWRDSDNTLRAFEYSVGGVAGPRSTLTVALSTKAQASASLVGLDRVPGSSVPPTQSDLRWLKRLETWRKADDALRRLNQNDSSELREQIVDTALFSIWWTVFIADANMRSRLRTAFVGICPNSFDPNGSLQARAGGQL